ncbi:MAG: MFS transporter [Novosphingobium sp.]
MRDNGRPIFAATFGLGTGSAALTLATAGILAPQMISDLGWTRSQFALLGMLSLIPSLCFPIAGRLADVIGVKRTVLIGIVALPVAYLCFSIMTGPVWQYIVIQAALGIFAITTTGSIYSRIGVQYVREARGLALAIIASGPAITGVFLTFLVNALVEAEGWRLAYQSLAAFAAACGVITLLLLPRERAATAEKPQLKRRAREDYPVIFRAPEFWLLLAAMLTCNLPQILVTSQLKLVLLELQVRSADIALILASMPVGLMAGRFVSGFALDRCPPHIVACLSLGAPCIGLVMLGTGVTALPAVMFAVLSMGFALGAESDILAFIVARKFGIDIFSSVMGLLTMAISLSVTIGSGLLSLTLKLTGGFNTFLWLSLGSVLIGSLLVLMLGEQRAETVPAE